MFLLSSFYVYFLLFPLFFDLRFLLHMLWDRKRVHQAQRSVQCNCVAMRFDGKGRRGNNGKAGVCDIRSIAMEQQDFRDSVFLSSRF